MPTGTITRVFEQRGFGYITPDRGDRDVFVNAQLIRTQQAWLEEGRRVTFQAEDSDSGLCATHLEPLG